MNNATISRVGVILFALVFGFFGLNHLLHADAISGVVPVYFPGNGKIWVYLTGLGMLAAALAFLLGKYVKLAGLLLALMLLVFVLTIHLPAVSEGNDEAITMLLKDLALAAGALVIAGKG